MVFFTVDSVIRDFLNKKLDGDADVAIDFLTECGFCKNGQIVVGSIFVFAKEQGVSVEAVVGVAKKEYECNWQFQHPEIRGNPDALGAAGEQNRLSLLNVYNELGVSKP